MFLLMSAREKIKSNNELIPLTGVSSVNPKSDMNYSSEMYNTSLS